MSLVSLLLVCCIFVQSVTLNVAESSEDSNIYVQTSSGKVQGKLRKNSQGSVTIFNGIPYAKSPVGERRFKPSNPLVDPHGEESKREIKFENVVPACMQPLHGKQYSHPSLPQGGIHVSEDCLKLSIYMPTDVKKQEKLPILLWIPGDGFEYADGSQYDGSAMATLGHIIVAVANYRVGIFGFVSNGTSNAPGNAGLHDIMSALKWIIYNAENFNGSSEDITLGGRFSGSMAISALISSPKFVRDDDKTKPLVSQIIMHGGVAGGYYTVERNPVKSFENFVGLMNCHSEDNKSVMDCLVGLSAKEILEKSHHLHQSWRPTIDTELIVEDPLTNVEMGRFSKNLKIMIGDNGGSGSLCYLTHSFLSTDFAEKFDKNKISKADFLTELQNNIKDFFNEEEKSLTSLVAHEYLYGIVVDESDLRDAYSLFCGTLYIRNPTELYARYLSRFNNQVYRYEFSYRPDSSPNPKFFNGAVGDEIIFLFPPNGIKMNKQDDSVMNTIISSWISFIKPGSVSIANKKWEFFDEDSKKMILINEDGLVKETTSKSLDREIHFWRSVFPPVVNILRKEAECQRSKTHVKSDVIATYDLTTHYLAVFLILVGLCLTIALAVYFIRNWSKPYLWKFT